MEEYSSSRVLSKGFNANLGCDKKILAIARQVYSKINLFSCHHKNAFKQLKPSFWLLIQVLFPIQQRQGKLTSIKEIWEINTFFGNR